MVGAGASPAGRRAAPVLPWLLPAAVVVAAVAVAAAVVPAGSRTAAYLCGAAALVAVALLATEALRRGQELTRLRDRSAALERRLARQEVQTARLGEVLLPQAVARIQRGDFVEDVLRDAVADGPEGALGGAPDGEPDDVDVEGLPRFQDSQAAVLRSVLGAVAAEENLRESAQRAFVNIARRVQAIVHQQAQDLQEMEHRHGRNPEVFNDLLQLDHGFARVGRLADSMAVLGGTRPGRQWGNAVPLYNVLRGAMSRILDYQRVELHSVSEVAIVGPAVEPLIHALAELLDNATLYSPPQTRVHLTAVDVQAGIAVEIEDGGLGLSEEGRIRAERMLEEAQAGIDLNDLGETPRLGLAVVGRLARAHNFQVSLRPSAYRGVRAVLIVPPNLITTATAGRFPGLGASYGARVPVPEPRPLAERDGAADPGRSRPAPEPPVRRLWTEEDDEAPVIAGRTPGGLPQRRRRGSAAPAGAMGPGPGPRGGPGPGGAPSAAPEPPGMWLSAFHGAVNDPEPTPTGGRATYISDDSSDEVE